MFSQDRILAWYMQEVLTDSNYPAANRLNKEVMSDTDAEVHTHRIQWRELSRNLTQREILYFISGSPSGVRETKIKSFMHDVFRFSFDGSIDPHLKKLEADGLLTKDSTRSGATIWHANQPLVIEMVQKELEEMKYRERELRDLHAFLIGTYAD